MKRVLSFVIALVLITALFSACKKEENNNTTQPQTETTEKLIAVDGKSFDEIKAAFEKAFSGKGYNDLESCYIADSDNFYSAVVVCLEEEYLDYEITKENFSDVTEYFDTMCTKETKIDWDAEIKGSDLLHKYYGKELNEKELSEANKKLEDLNRIVTASLGYELYSITDLINVSAAVENLNGKKGELRALIVETERGCFLLAFDKHLFMPDYYGYGVESPSHGNIQN